MNKRIPMWLLIHNLSLIDYIRIKQGWKFMQHTPFIYKDTNRFKFFF